MAAAQAFSIAEQEWGESALQVASAQVSSSCICICSAVHANAKAQHSTARGGACYCSSICMHSLQQEGAVQSGLLEVAESCSSVLFKYRGGEGGYAPLVHLLAVASKGGGVARGGA